MRTRPVGLLAAAALGAAVVNATVVCPQRLRVDRRVLVLAGWPRALEGVRVAVVGDVHAGAPWMGLARVQQLAATVAGLGADLVLLVGDHVADVALGRPAPLPAVAAALAGVAAGGAEVVGVLGNHDWYAGGHLVRQSLVAAGLPVLEEQSMAVLDGRLWVAGVGDLWERSPSVPRALAGVPPGAPTIVLTHNPDQVVAVPSSVALVVAGHTHGGQVAPLGRQIHRVSAQSGNRWLKGWYPQERLYVTGGVGSSFLPLRTVVPEIGLLELRAG